MKINGDWQEIIKKDYIIQNKIDKIVNTLMANYAKSTIYPSKNDVFRALNLTSFKNLKGAGRIRLS